MAWLSAKVSRAASSVAGAVSSVANLKESRSTSSPENRGEQRVGPRTFAREAHQVRGLSLHAISQLLHQWEVRLQGKGGHNLRALLESRALEVTLQGLSDVADLRCILRAAAAAAPSGDGDGAGGPLLRLILRVSSAPPDVVAQLLRHLADAADAADHCRIRHSEADVDSAKRSADWALALLAGCLTGVREVDIKGGQKTVSLVQRVLKEGEDSSADAKLQGRDPACRDPSSTVGAAGSKPWVPLLEGAFAKSDAYAEAQKAVDSQRDIAAGPKLKPPSLEGIAEELRALRNERERYAAAISAATLQSAEKEQKGQDQLRLQSDACREELAKLQRQRAEKAAKAKEILEEQKKLQQRLAEVNAEIKTCKATAQDASANEKRLMGNMEHCSLELMRILSSQGGQLQKLQEEGHVIAGIQEVADKVEDSLAARAKIVEEASEDRRFVRSAAPSECLSKEYERLCALAELVGLVHCAVTGPDAGKLKADSEGLPMIYSTVQQSLSMVRQSQSEIEQYVFALRNQGRCGQHVLTELDHFARVHAELAKTLHADLMRIVGWRDAHCAVQMADDDESDNSPSGDKGYLGDSDEDDAQE